SINRFCDLVHGNYCLTPKCLTVLPQTRQSIWLENTPTTIRQATSMVCWVVSKNLSPHYCCNQKRGYLSRCYSYISETDGITTRPADPLMVRPVRRERRPTWCQNLCAKRALSCQNPILTGY